VRRAKCSVELRPSRVVANVAACEGLELAVPSATIRGMDFGESVPYDPSLEPPRRPRAGRQLDEISLDIRDEIPAASTVEPDRPPSLHKPATPPPSNRCAGCQKEPLVRASFMPFRQMPLDLVICLDNSASFCSQHPACGPGEAVSARTLFVTAGSPLDCAKAFIENVAGIVHAPEVHLALVGLGDAAEDCPLTADRRQFLATLHHMGRSDGLTLLAPALVRAHRMLGANGGHCRHGCWADNLPAEKAVVVITDGAFGDQGQAGAAAEAMWRDGVQVLFVKVGQAQWRSSVSLQQMAHAKPLPPKAADLAMSPTATGMPGRGVFEAPELHPALAMQALLPEVLKQVLRTSRSMRRARLSFPLKDNFEEVSPDDLDSASSGLEVALSDQPQLVDARPVQWEFAMEAQ